MEQKKFELPEIIFMSILVGLADIGEIAGELSLAMPFIGLIIFGVTKVYSFVTWLGIQFWLIMKGERGLWFAAGSIIDLIGIPFAQTATLAFTIYLANHPKAAQVASLAVAGAATVATAGAAAPAAAAEVGAVAGAETSAAAAGAVAAETEAGVAGAATAGEIGATETAVAETQAGAESLAGETGAAQEISPEALGEEESPFAKLQRLTQETPQEHASDYESTDADEGQISLDDETNEVDLRNKAA